jgi:GrpB-like predicted nucleotidyltransferase (UPF0157 family)
VPALDEPIPLCAYDERWPDLFVPEALRIAAGLPPEVAIEHIGSTAVPGLLAKPIIDVMLGVEPGCDVLAIRTELVALGYQDLGDAGVAGRLHFRRRGKAAFNTALVERGGAIWRANLAVRDYPRTNPGAAREYAAAKHAALDSGVRSLLAYSEYKGPVVDRLIEQALAVA